MGRHRLLGAALLSLLVFSTAAQAGPTSWSKVGSVDDTLSQAAMTRSPDGVAHIVWKGTAAEAGKDSAFSRTIAPDGTLAPTFTPIATWTGLSNPDVVTTSSGLLAVLPGLEAPAYQQMAAASAPFAGAPWDLSPGDVVASSGSAYYANNAGLTLGLDGTPFIAGAGAGVHRGLDPNTPNHRYQDTIGGGCCAYDGDIATDGATGQVWIGWISNATSNEGVYVHEVDTATGAPKGLPVRMPGSVTEYDGSISGNGTDHWRTPITGRPGQPGVWTAWKRGYPSEKNLVVWRIGDAAETVLSTDSSGGVGAISLTSDPAGRLWVAWRQRDSDGKVRVFAKRSNAAVSAWGGTVRLPRPGKTDNVWNTAISADVNGADIVANFGSSTGEALYQRRVLPGLKFGATPAGKIKLTKSTKGKKANVVWKVATENGPAAGATVTAGGKTATTDAKGRVVLPIGPLKKKGQSFKGTAALPGYAPATYVIRVV